MRVLALDIATRTGWATGVTGEKPDVGVEILKKPHETIDDACERIADLLIREIRDPERRPDLIAVEAPLSATGHRNNNSAEMALNVVGAARLVLKKSNIRYKFVKWNLVAGCFLDKRSFREFEDSRKAKKDETIHRCIAWGYLPDGSRDHDRADAIAVWHYAQIEFAKWKPPEQYLLGQIVPALGTGDRLKLLAKTQERLTAAEARSLAEAHFKRRA